MEVLITIRLLLGLLFLLSALPKLFSMSRWTRIIRSYSVLPESAILPVAFALPLGELGLALALLGGWHSRPVSAAAATALLLFSIAIGINVIRHNAIDCGCGGLEGSTQVGWGLVGRNLVLAVVACAVALDPPASITTLLDRDIVTVPELTAFTASAALVLITVAVVHRTVVLLGASRRAERALVRR